MKQNSERSVSGIAIALLLTTAVASVASTPAIGQRTGTRLDRSAGRATTVSGTDANSAIIVANSFAKCVARREGASARKALDLPFASPEQSKAFRGQLDNFDECLGDSEVFDQMTITPILGAGGAAEWFVTTELKDVDLSPLKGMSDEAIEKTAYHARNALEDLGLCVLRKDPAMVRALFRTRPTTQEEKTAFGAVAPLVGPCIMQGSKLTLNIPNLRAMLSYATYRAASKMGAAGA